MNTKEDVGKWLHDNLSSVLSFPIPPDLTEYILSIENERDVEDYLKTLLDMSDPRHKTFLENFKIIRHGDELKGYIKNRDDFNHLKDFSRSKKKGNAPDDNDGKKFTSNCISSPEEGAKNLDSSKKESSHKKKSKFVNLYSPEGEGKDVILLKGRHHCDCQATKHKLVNNCTKCGRIVCAQEGSGPCIFCDTLVCTKEEQDFINSNSKLSQKLYDNLMDTGKPEGWEKAMEQRDRLLEYDRTTQKRTRVIDDEGEYFSSSSVWLSKAEREKLEKKEAEARAKKHASRLDKKVTLDFAGRRIIEDEEDDFGEDYYADAMDKIEETLARSNVHPDFTVFQPTFKSLNGNETEPSDCKIETEEYTISKVQDKEFLEMADSGACLSLHQPWASLLVAGIMRHEGRTWYSSHRGRLWIAAASKTPTDHEIREIENVFRAISKNPNLKFPSSYPTSCLLGCVTLVDCLPQEEYRKKFPDGESESPYVFICEEPQELNLRFPITGRHKIYKLDSKIHQAAKKALLRMGRNKKL